MYDLMQQALIVFGIWITAAVIVGLIIGPRLRANRKRYPKVEDHDY